MSDTQPNDYNAPTWQPLPPKAPPPLKSANQPAEPARMPAAEARRRAGVLKLWSLGAAVLAFGALSGLAAAHVTGVTSAASAGASPTATPTNQDDNGSFFPQHQRGSDNGDTGSNGGGFNFGSGGTSQPPAASSGGS
jgi:hypothetical protein